MSDLDAAIEYHELVDWEVTIWMVRYHNGTREERAFTAVMPATSEAMALRGAYDYGWGINVASEHAWKFANQERSAVCLATKEPPHKNS